MFVLLCLAEDRLPSNRNWLIRWDRVATVACDIRQVLDCGSGSSQWLGVAAWSGVFHAACEERRRAAEADPCDKQL